MGREFIKIIEGMLSDSSKMLCLIFLYGGSIDNNLKREGRFASLECKEPFRIVSWREIERGEYLAIRPLQHFPQRQACSMYRCCPPPNRHPQKDNNSPERKDNMTTRSYILDRFRRWVLPLRSRHLFLTRRNRDMYSFTRSAYPILHSRQDEMLESA